MMDTHRYYVYTLAYPDGRVFYVGQGVKDRMRDHEREARLGIQSEKCEIIRGIWARGGQVVQRQIAFFITQEEALAYEHHLISSLSGLVNRNGGSGGFVEASADPRDEHYFGASIRRLTEDAHEYWSAREMANFLGYIKWDAFKRVIAKAEKALAASGMNPSHEIQPALLAVLVGSDTRRQIEDYHLTRIGFLMALQSADSTKSRVAQGKAYIAEQTMRGTAQGGSPFSASLVAAVSRPAAGMLTRVPKMKVQQPTDPMRQTACAIEEPMGQGGTMPEDLPTPPDSIQQVQRKEEKRIEAEQQPSLFEDTCE